MMTQVLHERYPIGKVNISAVNMQGALDAIDKQIAINKSAYICVTNVRTSMLSQKDADYCRIQNGSFLTVPDGKPLVWYARLISRQGIGRVSGVDLVRNILSRSSGKRYSHFFYGSTREVLDKMEITIQNEYPGVHLKGFYSPPFRELEDWEVEDFISRINKCKPTFLWVGLGAPKQERFMERIVNRLDGVILVGVGLAFEYIAGTVKSSPVWMQENGLEWLYRCAQQPIKARRFFSPFIRFIGILAMLLIERMFTKILHIKNCKR